MIYIDIEGLLKKHNKTKYWLVKEMNSNYTLINKIMRNETNRVEFETLEKLCDVFKCKLSDVIKREGE